MKRLAHRFMFVFLLTVASTVHAAPTISQTVTFTSVTTAPSINAAALGSGLHVITWTPTSASACTVKLEQSTDNASWSDLIAGQTCTSSSSTSITAYAPFVRVNVTALTGTSVVIAYAGSQAANATVSGVANTMPIGALIGANLNSTADQAIPIRLPVGATTYRVRDIIVTNASGSISLAAGGVYTATSKGGTAVVAAAQVYSALTSAVKTLPLTLGNTDTRTETTLYFSLTVAQGSAMTADIYLIGDVLK